MDAREWKLKPVQENYNLREFYDDDDEDEEEDALSLCDFALNSNNSSDWGDDFSKDDQSSSFDQDIFEFFSQDFTTKSSSPNDNIIFCGKLIPYKREKEAEQRHNLYSTNNGTKDTKKSSIIPWKSPSFNRSRSTNTPLTMQRDKSYKTSRTYPGVSWTPQSKGYDIPMKKVPLLANPTKTRWYLFAFGAGRNSMEMGLNDIKTRQSKLSDSKRRRSMKSPATMADGSGKKGRGWWNLIRILGCKSSHADVVKASLGLMPSW